MTHRYMREDIVFGLAFLVSVARWSGVAAPVAVGLLAIASAVLGEEIGATSPRTLEALGLDRLAPVALQHMLARGLEE
jgi:opine dehydrogenase